MSISNEKQKIKEEILSQDYFKSMAKSERILFVLRTFGPQNFTSLKDLSKMSKSTVSKYVNLHLQKDYIEKRLFELKNNQRRPKYVLTESGNKISKELFEKFDDNLILMNKINRSISKLSQLIQFYENISVDESIINRIIRIISKLGDRFFNLEQNEDLFMSLFFMFYNSALTPNFRFELKEFCNLYKVNEVSIDYHIYKIMSSNLGFHLFERGDDKFFFHSEDLLGTITLRLIKDLLIEELIHFNIEGKTRIDDLDKVAEDTAKSHLKMGLIWGRIKKEFELLIEKLFIKMALDMGFPKINLINLILSSKKFNENKLPIDSLIKIFNGSEDYVDLNLVPSKIKSDEKIKDISGIKLERAVGFCSSCGQLILNNVIQCPECKKRINKDYLLMEIDKALKLKYKHQKGT